MPEKDQGKNADYCPDYCKFEMLLRQEWQYILASNLQLIGLTIVLSQQEEKKVL